MGERERYADMTLEDLQNAEWIMRRRMDWVDKQIAELRDQIGALERERDDHLAHLLLIRHYIKAGGVSKAARHG